MKLKYSCKFCSSVALASWFQGLHSHVWRGATVLDNTDTEHFHYHRRFSWTALVKVEGQTPLVVFQGPDKPRDSTQSVS